MDIEEKFNKCEARLKELRAVGNSKIGVWKDFYMFCKVLFAVEIAIPEEIAPVDFDFEVSGDTISVVLTTPVNGGEFTEPELIPIHNTAELTKEELIAEIKKKAMEEINNL